MITIATNNAGKLREIREILQGIPIRSLLDAGIDVNPEENGNTLQENAYIKAKAVHDITGGAVIADDTGLFAEALGGAPGVKSARLAEPDKLCETLLSLMDGKENRKAAFITSVCFINERGSVYYTEGRLDGVITTSPRGENGFGYDPIFEVGGKTLAEMTDDEKNTLSHRGRAFENLKKSDFFIN
jgi:XTP/dITP diphosphohydrolase